MRELEKVLDKNEKVLWEGKPQFRPFFLSGFLVVFIIGVVFLLFSLRGLFNVFEEWYWLFVLLLPHFWIGVVCVFIVPLFMLLSYKHTYYAITNKRVLLQSGVIGRDFEIIDFENITNAEVRVGFFDKIFGKDSGSIFVYSAAEKVYNFSHISSPYEVFKFFKKVSHQSKKR